jgi:hypothetical protein
MNRADAFSGWLRSTPMPDFAALTSQFLWAFGSVSFTVTACVLLWRDASASQQAGIVLAGMLLGAWTGKSYQNRKSNEIQRTTSREFLQHQAEADAVRTAAAGAAAGAAGLPVTGTYPALPLPVAQAPGSAPIPPGAVPDGLPAPIGAYTGSEAHRWRTGDPQAGLG